MKKVSIRDLLHKEEERQRHTINLIPSENYASLQVRRALGTVFGNKYSEGYPGRRYYPGNEWVDQVEIRAQELSRNVFHLSGQWQVNVQAYSGSPANLACYVGIVNFLRKQKKGKSPFSFADSLKKYSFIGFRLDAGGHLTHGHPVNLSGALFHFYQYGLREDGWLNYGEVARIAKKVKPAVIVAGLTAYPRKLDFARFAQIAKKVGALLMVDMAHIAGLVAGGAHPSPFPHADIVTTTTHKTLRGPRGALIFVKRRSGDTKELSLAGEIDKALFPGLQGGPHDHQTYAIAVALEEALKPSFKKYTRQIVKNAEVLAQTLLKSGFHLVSGGTDNHLILIDLKLHQLEGTVAEQKLYEVGIVVNRNAVQGDPSPFRPSGIRLGTPAVTTMGMKEKEMRLIGGLINDTLFTQRPLRKIRSEVLALTRKFVFPS